MKIVGIMPARNEAWCLGLSARAALMWLDELVILDHASTDETPAICGDIRQEFGSRVGYARIEDPTWQEMSHRQMLLEMARFRGATHIAMIDADEVLSGNALPDMRQWVEKTPPGRILTLPWLCLRDGIDRHMVTGLWSMATVSTAFVDDPMYHWAAQGREQYDFHHRHPMGRPYVPFMPQREARTAGLMHLQFCSQRRLLAKQALYQAIEVVRWPGRKPPHQVCGMYRQTVREADAAMVRPAPAEWWGPYGRLLRYLDVDAEPWQEAELRRLVAEHGREKFAGLDFFGVV